MEVRLARPEAAAAFSRRALLTIGAVSLGLLGGAALLAEPLFSLLHLGAPPAGFLFFLVFLLSQWPGLFFEQLLTLRGRPWTLVTFAVLSASGFVVAVLLPLYQGLPLEDALRSLAVFAAVKAAFLLLWAIADGWANPLPRSLAGAPSLLKPWWRAAWPLMLYASMASLVTAFDPWFVNYWYEDDEAIFATFRYGAREIPLLTAFINGAMVVVLPRLAEAPADGLDLLRRSSRRLMHWVFGGALLLMITARWWWTPLFTAEFSSSLPLFRIYLFLVATRLLFPLPVLTARGHTRMLTVFGLLELLLNVVFSFLLAPRFGLVGIVWATVIAYFLDKLLLMAYLRYRTGIGPGRYTDWRWYGGYVALLAAAYLLV